MRMSERRRVRRPLLRLGAGLALLLLAAFGAWKLANARGFQLFGTLVARVDTTERVVALTFDDGPTPGRTEKLLAVLARHGAVATFFLVGRDIDAHPAQARAIAAAGHEIGNHSWSHRRLIFKSPSFIRAEVDRADAAIARIGYSGAPLFRPPYGKKLVYLPYLLGQRSVPTIMWDVEPDRDPSASAAEIARRAIGQVRPGSIVLLHVMVSSRDPSLEAVEPIVVELRRAGYRFATVSQLLALRPDAD
jgi:peptidoglycan-N-acetylglucosamine deacetylase